MIHRSHGTLAFTDTSGLPKPLEQIPMGTPLLKNTPARISCAVCFDSYWNSGFTSQVWTEGLHIKNCGGQGCIYTMVINGAFMRASRQASSSRQAAAGKQQQASSSRQEAGKKKARRRQEAAASSSKQQQAAASSRQAAGKQQASNNQRLPP